LVASNIAGKAINLAFTTAGHAMSYKITSMFSLPHGQAVIICLPAIWRHMLKREDDKLNKLFYEIAKYLGKDSIEEGIEFLEDLVFQVEHLCR
jgi:alcohol dehydrogenase class IV